MSVPRILLLTGTPPGDGSVGEIYLRDLCRAYPHDSLSCFVVTRPGVGQPSPDLGWLPVTVIEWPYERALRLIRGRLGGLTAFIAFQYARLVRETRLLTQAVQFGKQHKVELVWAVLNIPTIYHLANTLAEKLAVPLVTTIWDPPERIVLNLRLDRYSRRVALRDFDQALRKSLRCGIMSETMRDEYETKYGTHAIIMRHGVSREQCRLPFCGPNSSDRFRIGFAGSLYAVREWQALLSALSSVNWRINGKDLIIRVLGPSVNARGRAHIEYLGWRPMTEVIQLLSEADVNYLPYWFDPSYSLSVRLCFPTKLTTYLATGRPVFYHGPLDSSPVHFFRRFPVGLCCHSLEETEIIKSLKRFITDREFYAFAAQAGQAALDEELDLQVFRRRFATLIGIEEDELLPLYTSGEGCP